MPRSAAASSPAWVARWESAVRLLVSGVVGLTVGGVVAGGLGLYEPWTVVPLTCGISLPLVVAWERLPRPLESHDGGWALVVAVAAIVAIAAWHARHAGSFLFVTRDPALYNLTALQLANDGSLTHSVSSESALGLLDGLRFASQGFEVSSGSAHAQGFHGLGAVMAPLHWLGGISLMLKGPALVGAATLAVFRQVAVRLASPWVATAVTVALGVSIPYLAFTRDAYSEVLALFLSLAGLLLMVEGPVSPGRFALAGAVAGTVSLVRIDAMLMLSGFVLMFAILPVVVERRRVRRAEALAAALGLGSTSALGLAVGYLTSRAYVERLSGELLGVALVLAASLLAAAGVAVVTARPDRRRWLRARVERSNVMSIAASIAVGAALAWWLVAPAVLELRLSDVPERLIAGLQAREGVAVDHRRTYGESSLVRLAMHYGQVTLLLAILGAGLAIRRLVKVPDRATVALLLFALPSVPYLYRPFIYPDMPWAMRRFLPVVIPALLLFAAVAVDRARRHLPEWRPVLIVALAVVVGAPALASEPIWGLRPGGPIVEQIQRVCDTVPDDGVLLIADERLAAIGTTVFDQRCGFDAVGVDEGADVPGLVAAVAEQARAEGRVLGVLVAPGDMIDGELLVSERQQFDLPTTFIQRTVEKLPAGSETERTAFDLLIVPPPA